MEIEYVAYHKKGFITADYFFSFLSIVLYTFRRGPANSSEICFMRVNFYSSVDKRSI